ncbi:MAG: hypothetical protein ACM30I_10420 [Gemmatimonas sp.]
MTDVALDNKRGLAPVMPVTFAIHGALLAVIGIHTFLVVALSQTSIFRAWLGITADIVEAFVQHLPVYEPLNAVMKRSGYGSRLPLVLYSIAFEIVVTLTFSAAISLALVVEYFRHAAVISEFCRTRFTMRARAGAVLGITIGLIGPMIAAFYFGRGLEPAVGLYKSNVQFLMMGLLFVGSSWYFTLSLLFFVDTIFRAMSGSGNGLRQGHS